MRIRRPNRQQIEDFLAGQEQANWSYTSVGATRGELPNGYVIDRISARLGVGQDCFERAKNALRCWQHLQLGWVEPCWPETKVEEGAVVGVLARWTKLWFLNACRVVYVLDESDGTEHQFGFAYGTLAEHAESGEERFLLKYNHESQQVEYEILAFSRPNKWYAKLGYPLVRQQQKRFARDSLKAMQQASD